MKPRTAFNCVALLIFCAGNLPAASRVVSESSDFVGFATNGPVVYELFRITRLMTNDMIPNPRLATNAAYMRMFPTQYVYTNSVFRDFTADSMNHVIWTNYLSLTNGRDMRIWSERRHPFGWPTNPPIVSWNTNSLIYGMKGFTALSPCWDGEGAPGQVACTALTRRHAYTRGHGTAPDGFSTNFTGRKVWFLARNDWLVEAIVKRSVTRISVGTNGVYRDYMILLFDRDLPLNITPISVTTMSEVKARYVLSMPANYPHPIFQTEQLGFVSTGIEPLKFNTWKGGDSGSPDMLPLPNELVFYGGRSTTGPTPGMQADMDELCKQEGLDPARYQLHWADLSKYPSY